MPDLVKSVVVCVRYSYIFLHSLFLDMSCINVFITSLDNVNTEFFYFIFFKWRSFYIFESGNITNFISRQNRQLWWAVTARCVWLHRLPRARIAVLVTERCLPHMHGSYSVHPKEILRLPQDLEFKRLYVYCVRCCCLYCAAYLLFLAFWVILNFTTLNLRCERATQNHTFSWNEDLRKMTHDFTELLGYWKVDGTFHLAWLLFKKDFIWNRSTQTWLKKKTHLLNQV